ncbi:hypothetical protein [Halorussus salinus]|uniref:hypothetical protein n=1 Tax=Halorussus salinus TaxID=1364935 RepID=UPI0010922D74|nr:hypothetical protein [Halorussus salinus]
MTDQRSERATETAEHAEAEEFTTDATTALAVSVVVALVTAGYVLSIRGVAEARFVERTVPFLADNVGRSLAWVGAFAVVNLVGRRFATPVSVRYPGHESAAASLGRLAVVAAVTAAVLGATLELTVGSLDDAVYRWFGGGGVALAAAVTYYVLVRAPDLQQWVSWAKFLGTLLVLGGASLVVSWWETTNQTWDIYVAVVRWVYTPVVFCSFAVYYLVAFADTSQRSDDEGIGVLSLAALVALVECYRGPTDFWKLLEREDDETETTV